MFGLLLNLDMLTLAISTGPLFLKVGDDWLWRNMLKYVCLVGYPSVETARAKGLIQVSFSEVVLKVPSSRNLSDI